MTFFKLCVSIGTTKKYNFNILPIIFKMYRHQKKRHYDGLFKLKRGDDGIGYPYLKESLPPKSIIKWQFFAKPDLNKDQINKNEFPVLLLKDVENVGKEGDVVEVKRGFYRYFLLENEAAKPLVKYIDIPEEILNKLSKKYPPINTKETDKMAFEKAKNILTEGININIDSMAKWVITPFHLAKIVSIRTGFNVKPHHFQMSTHEIRKPGLYKINFKHENGIQTIIPLNITVIYEK